MRKPLMSVKPAAFLTYVRLDDDYEEGRLTDLRQRISGEVRLQTGDEFPIFQDRNDIKWGQNWRKRIEESIDASTFLIPILTPSFFKSAECRREVDKFIKREKALQRNDLILPLYYVSCAPIDDEGARAKDRLAKVLASRQYADWRELRFEPLISPTVRKTLSQFGAQIREALARAQELDAEPPAQKRAEPRSNARTRKTPRKQSPSKVAAAPARERSPARGASKTEPATLVVDAMHRGDHTTISDAIRAANAGERILVRPGLYEEGLVIDKQLEIIGEGDRSEIVVRAEGCDAILFRATMGRVANMTLRQAGGGEWFGVDVAQGRLELEGCDIGSEGLSCVGIHAGADPRLRRNSIHGGAEDGVYVFENGEGTLEDNDIFGNTLSGVEIASGANPTLRRNQIHDSAQSGIYVHDAAEGTIEDNDIFGNARSGVVVNSGGNPTLRRNHIRENSQCGIFVHEAGQGTLEDNDIFRNTLSGVEISSGANPTLRRNQIHDNVQAGVYAQENGQGTLENNHIFGNALAGVETRSGGNPTLRRNQIHDNVQAGVYVHDRGQGVFADNDIYGNARSGISTTKAGNPTVRRNRINRNSSYAISVHDGGTGTFEANDLRENAQGPWSVGADCVVEKSGNLEY